MKRADREDVLYLDCLPFMKILAYRYSRKMPNRAVYDPEEMLGIGNEVFVRALRKYDDEECCKFRTYFWTCLENEYRSLLHRGMLELTHSIGQVIDDYVQPLSGTGEVDLHRRVISSLTDQAARVFVCLVNPEQKLRHVAMLEHDKRARGKAAKSCKGVKSVRITKNLIARYLGIGPMQVSKSVNEVKQVLLNQNILVIR